jgi:quinol monooxygenase YgiN
MTEHASLIQVTTFRPAPGRRDDVLAVCSETQERAAAADGCFGAQTCTVDEDPDAVVAISRWRDRHSLEAFQSAEGGDPPSRVREALIDTPVTRRYTPVELAHKVLGGPGLREDPGYLAESGEAAAEDGSVAPIIGGLPAVQGSAWDIGAPLGERGAGLAHEQGSPPDQSGNENTGSS